MVQNIGVGSVWLEFSDMFTYLVKKLSERVDIFRAEITKLIDLKGNKGETAIKF